MRARFRARAVFAVHENTYLLLFQIPMCVVYVSEPFPLDVPAHSDEDAFQQCEFSPYYPNREDRKLGPERIGIVLITNGRGHYAPTLPTDLDWANEEKKVQFFELLTRADRVYDTISWKGENPEVARE